MLETRVAGHDSDIEDVRINLATAAQRIEAAEAHGAACDDLRDTVIEIKTTMRNATAALVIAVPLLAAFGAWLARATFGR